jgi:hypothetical protein
VPLAAANAAGELVVNLGLPQADELRPARLDTLRAAAGPTNGWLGRACGQTVASRSHELEKRV